MGEQPRSSNDGSNRFLLNIFKNQFSKGVPVMKNYLPKFFSILTILAACSLSVFAQVSTVGSITGTAKDPHGAVVPNASVTVKNNATGLQRTTTTSEDGIFTVPQLPTGTYTITIQATSGFKKAEVTAVKVDV